MPGPRFVVGSVVVGLVVVGFVGSVGAGFGFVGPGVPGPPGVPGVFWADRVKANAETSKMALFFTVGLLCNGDWCRGLQRSKPRANVPNYISESDTHRELH